MAQVLIESPQSSQFIQPTLHRLPNGLTIIAEQMPVEAVNLSLWLGIGSAVESNAINGMAHFLEHMIFKGTQSLKSGEFERLIEQRGAVTNAATSQDYTHYYVTSSPSDFATLAPLQIEVVLNAAIPDEPFERERPVILEEIRRANDTPRRRKYYRSMEMAFERLPYRRPVLGPSSVIEGLTPQQMRDFHATWYQPQSITAVAVGNLPVEQLIELVTQGFEQAQSRRAGAENSPLPVLPDLSPEAPFTQITRQDYIDPALTQARLVMMWRVPGMRDLDETYALDILASVLGHGRTARLFRDLREERQLVTSISASNMSHTAQGVFQISAQLPAENLEIVEQTIAQHLHTLQNELVSEREIQRIRTLVANRFVFGSETPQNRGNLYGYYQSVVGDLTAALTYPQRIQSVTAETLRATAQRYLTPDAYGVVTLKSA